MHAFLNHVQNQKHFSASQELSKCLVHYIRKSQTLTKSKLTVLVENIF